MYSIKDIKVNKDSQKNTITEYLFRKIINA